METWLILIFFCRFSQTSVKICAIFGWKLRFCLRSLFVSLSPLTSSLASSQPWSPHLSSGSGQLLPRLLVSELSIKGCGTPSLHPTHKHRIKELYLPISYHQHLQFHNNWAISICWWRSYDMIESCRTATMDLEVRLLVTNSLLSQFILQDIRAYRTGTLFSIWLYY